MAGPFTGSAGVVEYGAVPATLDDVRSWSIEETCEAKPYNSSTTAGQTKRLAGNKDWTGSFEAYAQDDGPLDLDATLTVGDFIDLDLYVDADDYYEGNALITSVGIEVDIEAAEIVGASVSFEGNGALSRSA